MPRPLRNTISDLAKPAVQSSLRHLDARGREPRDVPHGIAVERPSLEPAAAAEDRVRPPEREQRDGEVQEILVGVSPSRSTTARCPGSRRCCCRAASARSRRRQAASARPATESSVVRKLRCCRARSALIGRVVGRALDAVIPRAIVVVAVAVALAVGVVVLVVVGDEIAQREAVVGGDEVDAGRGPAAVGCVEVGAAAQAMGELAERLIGAAPVVAHRVAILAVPLRPQRRKVADLIAALADVPWLGDQLDLADDRILLDQIEERRQPIDFVQLARERRRRGRSGSRRRASRAPSSAANPSAAAARAGAACSGCCRCPCSPCSSAAGRPIVR